MLVSFFHHEEGLTNSDSATTLKVSFLSIKIRTAISKKLGLNEANLYPAALSV
jgi:hypothetical protein